MLRVALVLISLVAPASAQPRRPPQNVPTVTIGTPTVTGQLDKAIVRRYLKRNLAKLTYCYEKGLLIDPTLKGKLEAAWEILPSGVVANAGTMGIAGETAVCTKKVLESIEYPKPRDGKSAAVKVTMTLRVD
jgi:hypothetical protein